MELRPTMLALAVGAVAVGALAGGAAGDSTPIGQLPKGPVTSIETTRGALVAAALPRQNPSTGLVWRVARRVDSRVLRQVSEADVGSTVVVVFRVVGKGQASVRFGLTRGESSGKAVKSATYRVTAR